MKRTVLGLAILLGIVSSVAMLDSAHATDRTKFESLIGKFAADFPGDVDFEGHFNPKSACVCQPGGANTVGILVRDSGLVSCILPSFNSQGRFDGFTPCADPYVVLTK